MKNAEVIDGFCSIEDSMKMAINGVERAREEAQSNLTRIYWMGVKMQDNQRKFKSEEIKKADVMENALEELVSHYDEMIALEKNILSDFTDIRLKLAGVEDVEMDDLRSGMDIAGLYQKMNHCLMEGQICMNRQKRILQDANALELSLQERGQGNNWNGWYRNLKSKIKGVSMGE
jgi:hypothetical protein